MRWLSTLLLAALLTACAAAPRSTKPEQAQPPAMHQPDDLERIAELEGQLNGLLAEPEVNPLAPSPSPPKADVCVAACAREGAICDLTGRICAIADRNDPDLELNARCADAQSRCEAARSRVTARCACPQP